MVLGAASVQNSMTISPSVVLMTATSFVFAGVLMVAVVGVFVLVSSAKAVTIPAVKTMAQIRLNVFMGGNFPDPRSKVTGGINSFSSNSRWGCRRRRQKCRANGQSTFMAGLGTFRRRSDGIRRCQRHSSDFGLSGNGAGLHQWHNGRWFHLVGNRGCWH